MMFTDWFFAKNKPSLFRYPAYLGHTVHQEEYDKLNDIVKADRAIIAQQAREIEQLTEQLDNRETIYNLAVEQIREMQAELDALRQQQIMLSTTTPTNKRKPRETGVKP